MKPNTVAYLDGLLDGLDDLPDGAWAQVCQDRIAADPRFKGCDAYDVWMNWVKATSKQQNPEGGE